ncbi:MAG: ATP-binding protein [Candidatus Eremiobacteraeota bacterium]|nr:ATP-binding protein [Candidatus Eremiobacteraeota bacterium]
MASELRIVRSAQPGSAAPLRHALEAFMVALGVAPTVRIDIVTAVGEALANTIEHAYKGAEKVGDVELVARLDEKASTLAVEIIDHGTFIAPKRRRNRGLGLGIMKRASQSFTLQTVSGTSVRMLFDAAFLHGPH